MGLIVRNINLKITALKLARVVVMVNWPNLFKLKNLMMERWLIVHRMTKVIRKKNVNWIGLKKFACCPVPLQYVDQLNHCRSKSLIKAKHIFSVHRKTDIIRKKMCERLV